MSYTKALYYPTIDIQDERWLKNAILFWDEISTIVPESIEAPYQNRTSSFLYDEGILNPYFVSENNPIVESLKEKDFVVNGDALYYFNHRESSEMNPYSDERAAFYLHREKLPNIIQQKLNKNGLIDNDGWTNVGKNFANYYMTLLATKIAKKKHLCLLASDNNDYNLSTSYNFSIEGINPTSAESLCKPMADMIMFRLIVDGFEVNPQTPIEDLLKYKGKRKDELALFRNELGNLTNSVNCQEIESLEELQGVLKAEYDNNFLPALNDVKKSLSDENVSWIDYVGQYAASFCMSLSSLSDIKFNGMVLGAGVTLLTCAVSSFRKRRSIKRKNPYSYLLSLKADGIYIA